jgi:hypothetical protein
MSESDQPVPHIHYSIEQIKPLNDLHLNLYRIFAIDERAPGRRGLLASKITVKDA